jgi:hypothetical protein
MHTHRAGFKRGLSGQEASTAGRFLPPSPMKKATAPQAGEDYGNITGRYAYMPVSDLSLIKTFTHPWNKRKF